MNEFVKSVANEIMKRYYGKMFQILKKEPALLNDFTGFLLNPEKLIFYLGKNHLGIEYIGPERISELKTTGTLEYKTFDYTESDNLLKEIVGFQEDSTTNLTLPLISISEDLIIPTNRAVDKLVELNWNFIAQNYIMSFNCGIPKPEDGRFSRIINSFFFDADDNGLKTRHIKWLDFIPIKCDLISENYEILLDFSYYDDLLEHDLSYIYPVPKDYKYSKLAKLNRFVEFFGNKLNKEPEITHFLSQKENEFILSMFFSATSIHPQLLCKWQSEDKDAIQPDFFIEKSNGYADIVEFKLPYLKGNSIVGRSNRETFSAEINSYISQTRKYSTYFDDPNNRTWFAEKYNIKVYKPKRYLIVGRRSDFDNNDWQEIIADYKDIEIYTYDDLLDGVVVQFYKD
jgi:hypothetical protein